MPKPTRAPEAVRTARMWIDAKASDAASGEVLDTYDPGNGALLAHIPRGKKPDVDRAVEAAKRAQPRWAKLDPNEKAKILWRAGELILKHGAELARLESLDMGKPITNATMIDVPRTADTFFYFSGWATKIHGETIPVRGPFLNYTLREPLGIVAAITPWNFPMLIGARKIAPALACGNAVILKPPEEASLSSIRLVEILSEAGLPDGVCSVVTGLGEEAGAALVDHPDVAKISFTGGTDTGKLIMRNASHGLKKLALELGGKSPNIVFKDADLDTAAKAAVSAAFYNQGELCTCGSRLLLERSIHDDFVDAVVAGTKALPWGDSLDAATVVGPLVSRQHLDRVAGFVTNGEKEGATRRTGGATAGPGYLLEPTVFTGVTSDMALAREEIFGPVLSVLSFDDVEEAAAVAGATEFGLAAGIWTRDIGKAHALAQRIQAGTVWINTYNRFDAASPYGGMKQSGFGRLNGRAVLDEMTQLKSVWVGL